MKLWICFCILTLTCSVVVLFEEKYKVVYEANENPRQITGMSHLLCFDLKTTIPSYMNKTEIEIGQLHKDLQGYFNGEQKESNAEYLWDLTLNQFQAREYLIWNEDVCFHFKYVSRSLSLKDAFAGKRVSLFVFDAGTFTVIKLSKYEMIDDLSLTKVIHKPAPYSNCKANYSRHSCLNDCFKGKFRLSKYFYNISRSVELKETQPIHLQYDSQNKSITEHEKQCFGRCKAEDCNLIYFQHSSRYNGRRVFYRAVPVISRFEFWAQLVGLVTLICNVSFYQLLSAIDFLIARKARQQRVRKLFFHLKVVALFLGVVYLLCSCAQLIANYQHKMANPARRETTVNNALLKQDVINLAICIPVSNILARDYSKQEPEQHEINVGQAFGNMSMAELEQKTERAFHETVEEIFLAFQSKRMNISYTRLKRVLFARSFKTSILSRCFQLKIDPRIEPKYQQLLSISKLAFRLKHERYFLFILPSDKNFDLPNSMQYRGDYSFMKVETRRSKRKDGCVDYEKEHVNCRSRDDCFNRCFIRSGFDAYQNLTWGYHQLVLDKGIFSESEWENLYFIQKNRGMTEFLVECHEKFYGSYSCFDIKFRDSVKVNQIDKSLQIELYYDILRSVVEDGSLYKLILDILNLQTIFNGINAFKFLMVIIVFFRLQNNKFYLFIVYSTCAVGFGWHTHFIVGNIINGELSYSQHYEIVERNENAETLFCFDYNSSLVDRNKNLTGNYLNEITRELSAEKIFESVQYLNNTDQNDWLELKLNSSFSNETFRVEVGLFLQLKCFTFIIPVEYERNRFHFSVGNEILKVTFNRTFIESNKPMVYFFTRIRQSMQFSKILNLSFKEKDGRNVSYTVNTEVCSIKHVF